MRIRRRSRRHKPPPKEVCKRDYHALVPKHPKPYRLPVRQKSTFSDFEGGLLKADDLPKHFSKLFRKAQPITSLVNLKDTPRSRSELDFKSPSFRRAYLACTIGVWGGSDNLIPPSLAPFFCSVPGSSWKILRNVKPHTRLSKYVLGLAFYNRGMVLNADHRHPLAIARLPSYEFVKLFDNAGFSLNEFYGARKPPCTCHKCKVEPKQVKPVNPIKSERASHTSSSEEEDDFDF
jgi:hypothetical protein